VETQFANTDSYVIATKFNSFGGYSPKTDLSHFVSNYNTMMQAAYGKRTYGRLRGMPDPKSYVRTDPAFRKTVKEFEQAMAGDAKAKIEQQPPRRQPQVKRREEMR